MKKLIVLFALTIGMSFALSGVNLNTATQAELEALPGVGEKMAQEIIKARPLKSVDDLKNIKGVGDAKFKKLQSLVVVESAPTTAAVETVKTTTQKVTETASKAKDSVKTAVAKVSSKLAPGTKFNLNTASAEELEKLPGIGKKKAEAIVAGRPFSKVEDVMKIKGIKTGVFNKIKDYVTVN